jgi:hypothetical protein
VSQTDGTNQQTQSNIFNGGNQPYTNQSYYNYYPFSVGNQGNLSNDNFIPGLNHTNNSNPQQLTLPQNQTYSGGQPNQAQYMLQNQTLGINPSIQLFKHFII